MKKKLIRLTESDLNKIIEQAVTRLLVEDERLMSDEDIEQQYGDMNVTYFELNPLRYSEGSTTPELKTQVREKQGLTTKTRSTVD